MKRTKPKWNKPGSPQRIRADISKQVPTNSWGRPQYYHDVCVKCRDCKTEFVFTALEQKAWYEHYKIPHYADRVRCTHCSSKHKALEKTKEEYDSACVDAKARSDDYNTLLKAGVLTVELIHASKKRMNVERCVSWLKKCLKLKPAAREPLYLLGCCYEYAGNSARAIEKYEAFLEKTREVKQGSMKKWRALAETRLRVLREE